MINQQKNKIEIELKKQKFINFKKKQFEKFVERNRYLLKILSGKNYYYL